MYQTGPVQQPFQDFRPNYSNVELFLSCRNLKDLDTFSKSDPIVRMSIQNVQNGQWNVIGQTEVIKDNLNPDFTKTFIVPFQFEIQQPLCFDVFDYDNPSQMDFIGRAFTSVGNVMGAKNCTQILNLDDGKGKKAAGKLIIRGEESTQNGRGKDNCFFQFKGISLENKEFFGKSDPFLIFYRKREDNTWIKVHETEVIKGNLNPVWKPFKTTVQQLTNGDFYRPIKIECFDWEKDGKHELIGQFETNVNDMLQRPTYELKNPKKVNLKKYKNSGTIQVIQAQCIHEASFLEYIEGDCQISFMVAIDFTASNGLPHNPTSLHYINPSQPNEYERAIMSVGRILEQYDVDRLFPVWGFGASQAQGLPVSHCFPLTGNAQQPFVLGVQGILDVYRANLNRLYFNGPTLFQHIVSSAMQVAQQQWPPGKQLYHILLILTDGAIHDMRQTKSLIVDASYMPLSVIIVGVGNADFSMMEELDSDNQLLKDERGRQAARDIVQFVPFRKFQGDGLRLAQEVLAEVPAQLTGFMTQRGIQPIPKQQITNQNIQIAAPAVYSTAHPETFNLTKPMMSGIGKLFGNQLIEQKGQQNAGQQIVVEIQQQQPQQPQPASVYPQAPQISQTVPQNPQQQIPYQQNQLQNQYATYPQMQQGQQQQVMYQSGMPPMQGMQQGMVQQYPMPQGQQLQGQQFQMPNTQQMQDPNQKQFNSQPSAPPS